MLQRSPTPHTKNVYLDSLREARYRWESTMTGSDWSTKFRIVFVERLLAVSGPDTDVQVTYRS